MYAMYIKQDSKGMKGDSPEFFLSLFLKKITVFSIRFCCCQAVFEQTFGFGFHFQLSMN